MAIDDTKTLKDQYDLEFDRKETLENKANNMTSVAGVVAALTFGFGQFLIEKLSAIHYDDLSYIIGILLFAILSSVVSIIFSVLAFRIQRYHFLIGHTAVEKPTLRAELKKQDGSSILGLKTGQFDDKTRKEQYVKCIEKNSEKNDLKAKVIDVSMWAFVSGVVLIVVLFAWLLFVPISFPG